MWFLTPVSCLRPSSDLQRNIDSCTNCRLESQQPFNRKRTPRNGCEGISHSAMRPAGLGRRNNKAHAASKSKKSYSKGTYKSLSNQYFECSKKTSRISTHSMDDAVRKIGHPQILGRRVLLQLRLVALRMGVSSLSSGRHQEIFRWNHSIVRSNRAEGSDATCSPGG
jgi:hypothetical protein